MLVVLMVVVVVLAELFQVGRAALHKNLCRAIGAYELEHMKIIC